MTDPDAFGAPLGPALTIGAHCRRWNRRRLQDKIILRQGVWRHGANTPIWAAPEGRLHYRVKNRRIAP